MTCKDCKYLGVRFPHLDGHEGVKCWYHCKYPLPFCVTPVAIRLDIEHDCKVKEE
jgi:hypothetical protein